MLTHRHEPPLDPKVLEEAAEWLMRLSENDLSDTERAQWECWKVSSPERDRAWSRAQLLQRKLGGLPPSLAMSALDRPSNPERRMALGKLAMLLAVLPAGWGSWKLVESQQWSADYRTAVGQRRELTLADGSHITSIPTQPSTCCSTPISGSSTCAKVKSWCRPRQIFHRWPAPFWSAHARAGCRR